MTTNQTMYALTRVDAAMNETTVVAVFHSEQLASTYRKTVIDMDFESEAEMEEAGVAFYIEETTLVTEE